MASLIYRYKFRENFLSILVDFSRIHQYDTTKDFKEEFKTFTETNKDIIQSETKYLTNNGYKGDVIDKMYKSARYYFKNKDYNPSENKKRRKYIKQDKEFIAHVDEHVINSIRKNSKPAKAFGEFMENDKFKDILTSERERLDDFLDTDDDIHEKIKKTYKNRFFIQKRLMKENACEADFKTSPTFVPNVSAWELQEWLYWQDNGGRKPYWFMTNDKKANDIMRHYEEVMAYYNN